MPYKKPKGVKTPSGHYKKSSAQKEAKSLRKKGYRVKVKHYKTIHRWYALIY